MNKASTTSFESTYQTGVGLVEVLVALIIMSVGLLGIASLYVTALQAKNTSLSRMKAVNLAQDMADRIRANPTAVTSYALAETGTTTQTNCATRNCTGTEMAQYDVYEWDRMITDTTNGMGLPGQAKKRSITVTAGTSTTPATVTISLTWQEKNSGDLTYSLQIRV